MAVAKAPVRVAPGRVLDQLRHGRAVLVNLGEKTGGKIRVAPGPFAVRTRELAPRRFPIIEVCKRAHTA